MIRFNNLFNKISKFVCNIIDFRYLIVKDIETIFRIRCIYFIGRGYFIYYFKFNFLLINFKYILKI